MVAFPRTELARQVVQALQGRALFGDAHNGLFLAAPRRTGKSTFLQYDLRPALEAAGIEVIYVDLWSDPRRDPGSLRFCRVSDDMTWQGRASSIRSEGQGVELLCWFCRSNGAGGRPTRW